MTPVSRRSPARVPVPLTETVGREDEIATVLDGVAQGRRLLTIVGPGGIGKSRVLHEVGGALAETWEIGYVDLFARSDVSVGGLAEAVGAALDVGELERCRTRSREWWPPWGVGGWLLLLDEAEWALEPVAELVQTLLDRCPGLVVVTTSRVSLRILGERIVLVDPLPCPAEDAEREAVLAAPAVRLFVARLLDLAPELDVAGLDPALLGEVARRVDGLPLGLVILAGHGATRSQPDLLDLLDHPLDVSAVTRTPASRHRSLRETLAWSVGRLGPEERALFRRLGVFNTVIDPQAARAVAAAVEADRLGDVDESLRLLVREGLLQVDRTSSGLRYRMLRTVMDLAVEELDAAGEHEQLHRGVATVVRRALARATALGRGARGRPRVLRRLPRRPGRRGDRGPGRRRGPAGDAHPVLVVRAPARGGHRLGHPGPGRRGADGRRPRSSPARPRAARQRRDGPVGGGPRRGAAAARGGRPVAGPRLGPHGSGPRPQPDRAR